MEDIDEAIEVQMWHATEIRSRRRRREPMIYVNWPFTLLYVNHAIVKASDTLKTCLVIQLGPE